MGPDDTRGVHLVVLLHGLYGAPANLWCLEAELKDVANQNVNAVADTDSGNSESEFKFKSQSQPTDPEVVVLVAKSYIGARTWDGIDVNAHRVAEEVDDEIARLESEGKRVVAFSVTGYSLGGLIARALVGILHARSPSFFTAHKPASFSTIATPHLGVLRYASWQNTAMHAIGQHLFSRTGRQLYCLDGRRGRGFLAVLADPDRIYLQALSAFPTITIVANGVNDLTVPFPTAAISATDPFADHEVSGLRVELKGRIVRRWYRVVDVPAAGEAAEAEVTKAEVTEAETTESGSASTGSKTPTCMNGTARDTPGTDLTVTETTETTVILDEVTVDHLIDVDDHPPSPYANMPRPMLPPVFYLPYRGVFRYALFPLIPFLIPVALTFMTMTFALHTFQSAERIRLHRSSTRAVGYDTEESDAEGGVEASGVADASDVASKADDTANTTSYSTTSYNTDEAHDTKDTTNTDEADNDDAHDLETLDAASSSWSRAVECVIAATRLLGSGRASSAGSGTSTPALVPPQPQRRWCSHTISGPSSSQIPGSSDASNASNALNVSNSNVSQLSELSQLSLSGFQSHSSPSQSPPPSFPSQSRTQPLLTPAQSKMIANLTSTLPQLERLVAWFPHVYNAHASIIARAAKQFKYQEEGRWVVRAWARRVVLAGEKAGEGLGEMGEGEFGENSVMDEMREGGQFGEDGLRRRRR